MYKLIFENSFKKDFSKIIKQNHKIESIINALALVASGNELPDSMRKHKLKGEFSNCWDCHIENDLVLIYKINDSKKLIYLTRIGSHSEILP